MKKKILLTAFLVSFTVLLSACSITYSTGGKSAGVAVSKTLSKKSFSSIKTNISTSNLEIKKGKNYEVYYQGHKKLVPVVKVNNGELTIKQDKFGSFTGKEKITVITPGNLKNINLKTDEGDVAVSNVSISTGKIKSSEGDIDFNSLFTKNKFKLVADEGDINISTLKMQNGLIIIADEGDVNVNKVNASGYDLLSNEGDISVKGKNYSGDDASHYSHNLNSKNVLRIIADEGDIEVN